MHLQAVKNFNNLPVSKLKYTLQASKIGSYKNWFQLPMISLRPCALHSITLECQPEVNPGILMQDCSTAELPIIASIPADWLFLHQWLKLGTAGPRKLEFNNSQLSESSWRSMFLSPKGERSSDSSPPLPALNKEGSSLWSCRNNELSKLLPVGNILNTCHKVEVSVEATWIFDGLNNKVQQTSCLFLFTGIVHWPSKAEQWELGLNWEGWASQTPVKSSHLKWDWGWLSRHHNSPFLQLLVDFTKKKWHWNPG